MKRSIAKIFNILWPIMICSWTAWVTVNTVWGQDMVDNTRDIQIQTLEFLKTICENNREACVRTYDYHYPLPKDFKV